MHQSSKESTAVRVVIEPQIPSHDAKLYEGDRFCDKLEGWPSVDATAIEQFEELGFIIVRGGLSAAEVESCKSELERMTYEDAPGCKEIYFEGGIREHITTPGGQTEGSMNNSGVNLAMGAIGTTLPDMDRTTRAGFVRKFQGFVHAHPPLMAAAMKPEMIAVIERMAGEKVILFQDMAMIKPAGGREKPWHQDHAYFNFPVETKIVGAWIALGQVTPENGCMFVVAGGHLTGPRIHFRKRDWQLCDTEIAPQTKLALPMGPGDVLLFSAKLPHGTPTNRTQDHRWALQYHYVPQSAQPSDVSVRLAAFGSEGKDVTC